MAGRRMVLSCDTLFASANLRSATQRIAKLSSKSNVFDVAKPRAAGAFTDALEWAIVLSLFRSYGDLRKYEV